MEGVEAVEIKFQWKAFKGVIFWGRKKCFIFFIFFYFFLFLRFENCKILMSCLWQILFHRITAGLSFVSHRTNKQKGILGYETFEQGQCVCDFA